MGNNFRVVRSLVLSCLMLTMLWMFETPVGAYRCEQICGEDSGWCQATGGIGEYNESVGGSYEGMCDLAYEAECEVYCSNGFGGVDYYGGTACEDHGTCHPVGNHIECELTITCQCNDSIGECI